MAVVQTTPADPFLNTAISLLDLSVRAGLAIVTGERKGRTVGPPFHGIGTQMVFNNSAVRRANALALSHPAPSLRHPLFRV